MAVWRNELETSKDGGVKEQGPAFLFLWERENLPIKYLGGGGIDFFPSLPPHSLKNITAIKWNIQKENGIFQFFEGSQEKTI